MRNFGNSLSVFDIFLGAQPILRGCWTSHPINYDYVEGFLPVQDFAGYW